MPLLFVRVIRTNKDALKSKGKKWKNPVRLDDLIMKYKKKGQVTIKI